MNMEDLAFDLDLLRALVAVSEAGSFTAAASIVGRSQSAVSQKIRRLEGQLGIRVFDRTSRSLRLTQDGQRLLVVARRILEQYDTFVSELKSPQRMDKLRLGISENLVYTQLPRFLGRFNQLYPDVHVELTTGNSNELLKSYDVGELDVVIAKRREGRSSLGQVIWREPLMWMTSSEAPQERFGVAKLVAMPAPCAYRELMIETLNSVRREWVISCTATNLTGLQAAVRGGFGVTVLGASFLDTGMRAIPPSKEWPPLPMTEVAVIGRQDEPSQWLQPLVTLMTEELANSKSLTIKL